MTKNKSNILSFWIVSLAVLASVLVGCSKADTAPTNTKGSEYMGGGNTSADKVAAERARARLPHGGQGSN